MVAVKSPKDDTNQSQRDDIIREYGFLCRFDSNHVLKTFGLIKATRRVSRVGLVLEYCAYGSLHGLVRTRNLTALELTRLTADCADGLAYLASRRFIHCDVAARNALVTTELRAKIADLGMMHSLMASGDYYTDTHPAPWRWLAPESLKNLLEGDQKPKYSTRTDVWAFGVLVRVDMAIRAPHN